MKRFIVGMIFGIALVLTTSAYADNTVVDLIGKTVQGMFPVTLNGKSIGNAIVVENKTYLPVRDFGEAAGYTVSFTDDRQVVLSAQSGSIIPTPEPEMTMDQIDEAIREFTSERNDTQRYINANPNSPVLQAWKDKVADFQKRIDALNQKKAKLQPTP